MGEGVWRGEGQVCGEGCKVGCWGSAVHQGTAKQSRVQEAGGTLGQVPVDSGGHEQWVSDHL